MVSDTHSRKLKSRERLCCQSQAAKRQADRKRHIHIVRDRKTESQRQPEAALNLT